MPISPNESRAVTPARPDSRMENLLALLSGQALALPAGGSQSCSGGKEDYWFIGAVRGSVTVDTSSQYHMIGPGHALAFLPEGPFTLHAVDGGQCMLVQLRGELPRQLLEDRLENGAALFPGAAPAVREAVLALSVLEEEHPPVSASTASAFAYTMLMAFHTSTAVGPGEDAGSQLSPLVEAAVAIIQEEFPFLEGVDELAERLEVSKGHLIRAFRQKTGIPPGKYITRTRVGFAKLLLQSGETSITYVAEASGFANSNYFAKVFHRETGMSPSEYMQGCSQHGKSRKEKRVFYLSD